MLREKVFHHFSILLGLLGCVLICVGVFIPLITVGGVAKTVIGEIGMLIPILAVTSAIACFFSETIIPTFSTILILYFLSSYIRGINEVLSQYTEYSYGFYIIAVGIILLAAYSFFGVIDKFTYLINYKKKRGSKAKIGVSMKSALNNNKLEVSTNNQPLISPTIETQKIEEKQNSNIKEIDLANNQAGIPELDLNRIAKENEVIKEPVKPFNQENFLNNNVIIQESQKEQDDNTPKFIDSPLDVQEDINQSNNTIIKNDSVNQMETSNLDKDITSDSFFTPDADFIVNSDSNENHASTFTIPEPDDNIFTQNPKFDQQPRVESDSIISQNINGMAKNIDEPTIFKESSNKFFGDLMDQQTNYNKENNQISSQLDLQNEMSESKILETNQTNYQVNNSSSKLGAGDEFNNFFNQTLVETPNQMNNQNNNNQ